MTNHLLVEIHSHIGSLLNDCLQDLSEARAGKDEYQIEYLMGQLHELKVIRAFLSKHFDLSTQKYY